MFIFNKICDYVYNPKEAKRDFRDACNAIDDLVNNNSAHEIYEREIKNKIFDVLEDVSDNWKNLKR